MSKLREHTNNQAGATLAYTLAVIAILIFVGAALATFAVTSLRLSVMQHSADKAFYLSDAAIEESLMQLESISHDAQTYALARVNDTARYYSEPKWEAFLMKLEYETNSRVISKEESTALLKQASNFEFYKQYCHYLFGAPVTDTWLLEDYELLNGEAYQNTNTLKLNPASFDSGFFDVLETVTLNPASAAGFEATSTPTVEVTSAVNETFIELEIVSNGRFNQFQKPIKVVVALKPPQFDQVTDQISKTDTIHENVILNQALASRGDLIVANGGAKVEVIGDVYAYGTFPEKSDYKLSELGGLLVGYRASSNIIQDPVGSFDPGTVNSSGNMEITGDLAVRGAVRLFDVSSALDVGSSLYANGVQFDSASDDGRLNIQKNAYFMEDIVLDGNDPSLTVGASRGDGYGELWGVMEHEPSGSITTGKSDVSSSIVISTKSTSPRITVNNAFIAGLAYFDVFRSISGAKSYYQTGESFTTNNNFYYYTSPLPGYSGSVLTKFFAYTDETGTEHSLIEAIDSATGDVVQSPKFKNKYFIDSVAVDASAVSDRDRQIFTIRSIDEAGGVLSGLEGNYSLGVMIANQKVIDAYPNEGLPPGGTPLSEYMDDGSFTALRKDVLREMDLKMNLLSTRDYAANVNQDPGDATPSKLGQLVDFSLGNITQISDPRTLVVINGNEDRNVYVNVPASVIAGLPESEKTSIFIQENNEDFKSINGIIITKGNVFVYNNGPVPLSYRGTIVSDKGIFLLGNGQMRFESAVDWLSMMAVKLPLLGRMLHVDSGKSVEIAQTGSGVLTSTDTANLSLTVTDNPNTRLVLLDEVPVRTGAVKEDNPYSFEIMRWSVVQ